MSKLLIAFAILLVLRFICFSEGKRMSTAALIALCALLPGAFLLSFQSASFAVTIAFFLLIPHALLYLAERWIDRPSAALRTITLLVSFIIVCFASIAVNEVERMHLLRPMVYQNIGEWLVFATAVLLCLKESNYVIRWFFQHYKLVEKVRALADSPSTENGRVIGNLERLLLLVFLWDGAALAATIIVAIKGLARFKKMEEHQAFAEYVIIGTFLSVLLTIGIIKCTRWIVY